MNLTDNNIACLELDDFVEALTSPDYLTRHLRFPQGKNGYFSGTMHLLEQGFRQLPATYVQNYYKVYLLEQGQLRKVVQTEPIDLGSQTLYITKPGQFNRWHAMDNTQGYVIAFSKEFLYSLQEQRNMLTTFPFLSPIHQTYFKVDTRQYRNLARLITRIHREYEAKSPSSYELVRVYTLELLLKSKRYSESERETENVVTEHPTTGSSAADISQRFVERMEAYFVAGICEGYVAPRSVADYAHEVGVNQGHLNDCLKKHLGKTAKALINERLLIAIQCKLLHSDLSVAEIGYALGFESPSYFNRFFRKLTGQTPADYRSQPPPFNRPGG